MKFWKKNKIKKHKIINFLFIYRLIGRLDGIGPLSLYLEAERFKFGRS
jgi:hypothetical protein